MAIGTYAGFTNQGNSAVAIGNQAGFTNQGTNAIAIGNHAGETNQAANSIILNASGVNLNSGTTGFFVAPVQSSSSILFKTLLYDSTASQVYVSSSKTFVIPHPLTPSNRYLVHGCLEGPEGGVYYRGKGKVGVSGVAMVSLPEYVDALATDFTVQITPLWNGRKVASLNVGEVERNQFTVHGEQGEETEFYWVVHGKRCHVEVEPLISETKVKGEGPYRWI